jgi:hypothetical protein
MLGVIQMGKIRLLFLAANPEVDTRLNLDVESREIEAKIRLSEYSDLIEVVTKWAVRTDDLVQHLLQYRPHIVHFSGHGSKTEEIVLLDRMDNPAPVTKDALSSLFATLRDNVRVVVLNSCYSEPQAAAIAELVGCAVGMKHAIGDESAITFAAAFYQAIGFGRSVKTAFDLGTTSLKLGGFDGSDMPTLLTGPGVDAASIVLVNPH